MAALDTTQCESGQADRRSRGAAEGHPRGPGRSRQAIRRGRRRDRQDPSVRRRTDCGSKSASSKSTPNMPSSRTLARRISLGRVEHRGPGRSARQSPGRQRREPDRDFDRLGRRAEDRQQAGVLSRLALSGPDRSTAARRRSGRRQDFTGLQAWPRFKKATKSPPTSSPAKPPGKPPAARGKPPPVRRPLAACWSRSRGAMSTR